MAWQGFAMVLMGAFLFAFYEVANKKLLIKNAPSDCIGTVNMLGSGALLLAASFLFNPPRVENWFDFSIHGLWLPLLATSVLNIIIQFGNLRALKLGDVSLVAPISAAQPMIVLIPSWFILGEVPGMWGYIGLLLLAVGFYVLSFAEEVFILDPVTGEKKPWHPPEYLLWMGKSVRYVAPWYVLMRNRAVQIALVVAACGAVAVNFDKLGTIRAESITFVPGLILLFCGVVGLAKTLITGEWKKVEKEHITRLIQNPLLYTLVMVCYWAAFLYGFAAYVGAMKRTTIVFTLILGWLILKEVNVKKRWPGAIIMMIGAAFLGL
ncbi:MAG: hypothetical protein A3G11_00210 [Candidatus Lloydbacteria bacterium RIFCSPLOWO2_12_FULL_51_9]|uniref:EamA domain-containing protein n=1 Tax=Candidatus Lloydbacteria bacterium RIFCSPLOWO2_12_FULL_51_9 TaxID=1798669 RepID=A0A1G2DVA5_9BACT|nr:MAG: hypothetical protein A3G11_00210 [Candidatus Lloydbacteria bacterium RIFCSPLOWO2_12_FULL_51_9]